MLTVRKKHRGIGLLELMLSLAIIAAVILMATRYFSQASEASKVTQSTEIIRTLIDASFKWVKGNPDFLGEKGKNNPISITELITTGLLPRDWENKTDPWNGPITLEPYVVESPYQIKIQLPNVPISACKSINDIMIKQGIKEEFNCKITGYAAIYPAENPYPKS